MDYITNPDGQMASSIYKVIGANTCGNDYLCGDLHGYYNELMAELSRVKFNEAKDRLFICGDFCDRGPLNTECLRLINKSWCFFVPGNHDLMLLDFLDLRHFDFPFDLAGNGGGWLLNLREAEKQALRDVLIPRMVKAPLVLRIEDTSLPFNLVHAELVDYRVTRVLTDSVLTNDPSLAQHEASFVWGRGIVEHALNSSKVLRALGHNSTLWTTPTPWAEGLSLTYVGHSIVEYPLLHLSHLFLDTGSSPDNGKTLGSTVPRRLTLINHSDTVKTLKEHHLIR